MIDNAYVEMIAAIVKNKPDFKDKELEELREPIEKAAIHVSRYCRLKKLPLDLRYVLADMAVDIYKMDNYVEESKEETTPTSRIKSLKQGDTTVEFISETKTTLKSMKEIMSKYCDDLAPYRSVFWR